MERQDNDWIVEIKDMSFSYAEGSRVILDDVSLSFRKGEVIAIMGGSGMGKTTLLKLIGGLLTPDKGEVFIDGERLNTANLESRTAPQKDGNAVSVRGAVYGYDGVR